jgi:hypothetical protein
VIKIIKTSSSSSSTLLIRIRLPLTILLLADKVITFKISSSAIPILKISYQLIKHFSNRTITFKTSLFQCIKFKIILICNKILHSHSKIQEFLIIKTRPYFNHNLTIKCLLVTIKCQMRNKQLILGILTLRLNITRFSLYLIWVCHSKIGLLSHKVSTKLTNYN